MLGALHARRLYEDKKIEEKREKGIELEFHPDIKASFLGVLPLRSISRAWGSFMSLEIPVWMRPYAYKAWARAFHSSMITFFLYMSAVDLTLEKKVIK
jgi:phosphatidylserine decarboxylase